ncbi:OsmC-like protein [Auriscalpium vulgare]|uniref:OsmC-like protein n=1 Tax=Auriscalpium vulgare TaxID=40419 RepID=A0ACB8RFF0_9AGAM|nr:OsmC-like protein [Auriscalpium vulgare]
MFRAAQALSRPLTRQSTFAAPRRSLITIKKPLYTAHATARGKGRDGEVVLNDDDGLKLRLGTPKAFGGLGDGHDPEQLLAMGFAACFLTSLQLAAGRVGKTREVGTAVVHAQVHVGEAVEVGDYGLAVDIQVEGVDQELVNAGRELCPYSRAMEQGAVVNIRKA